MSLLSEKIKVLNDDIKKMENLGGFKKIVTEHSRIQTEIDLCMKTVNELNSLMESLHDDTEQNNKHNEITDDEYNEHINYLRGVSDVFDKLENVEEQIQIYIEAMNKINIVTKYLENRKMEIVKVPNC